MNLPEFLLRLFIAKKVVMTGEDNRKFLIGNPILQSQADDNTLFSFTKATQVLENSSNL